MRTIELFVRTFLTMNISDPNNPTTGIEGTGNHPTGGNDYPWFASIQVTNYHSGFHHCSGVLIDPNWVLTVAHCLESENPNALWVSVGENYLYKEKTKEDYLPVHFFVQHPNYYYYVRPYIFDIALVRLKYPVVIDEYVQPANLSCYEEIKGDCQELEWMENREKNEFYLRRTPMDFGGAELCHENFVNISGHGQNFCAEKKVKDDLCESKAATVLECVVASGEKAIVGLSSWVDSCGKPQKPIVYVNVSFHLSWIRETMERYKSGIPPNGRTVLPTTATPTTTTSTTTTTTTTSTPPKQSTKCKDKKSVTVPTTTTENTDSVFDYWGIY